MLCRRPILLSCAVAVAALSLLVAGCGGGGSPGVASITARTTTSTTSPQTGGVAFARCMRTHGLPRWPDPTSGGVFNKQQLVALGYARSQVRAAELPCGHLLPEITSTQQSVAQQRVKTADELSFARCMRNRGVSHFPDPNAQGELSIEMVEAQGIDIHSPQVLAVVQACLPASHGALTPAKVREALNHAATATGASHSG